MKLNMNTIIKKILGKSTIILGKEMIYRISRILSGIGSKKQCYICNRTFNHFTKFRGGSKRKSEYLKRLDIVGSDRDNFYCMYCGSHDRERHLYMYFDKLNIWQKMKDAKILYFAPERNLSAKINEQSPLECITADLHPKTEEVKKIDATKVPFSDEKFDFVIANHILEHIPAYSKALSEFYRVLKPGGVAILQTPYSKILKNNFEDENLDTDELRLFFYGQEDHVRLFGEYQFFNSIENAGFILQVKKHEDLFDNHMAYIYGVNKEEDLILVIKPS